MKYYILNNILIVFLSSFDLNLNRRKNKKIQVLNVLPQNRFVKIISLFLFVDINNVFIH